MLTIVYFNSLFRDLTKGETKSLPLAVIAPFIYKHVLLFYLYKNYNLK